MKLLSKIAFAAAMISPTYALAQSAEWIEPASGLVESISGGLVQIGVPIVGVGLLLAALWGGLTGNIKAERIKVLVIAGLLITAGPSMLTALFALTT